MSSGVIVTAEATEQTPGELYRDLHANPELSFAEHRTADIVARSLAALGYDVHTGIGGTGVVCMLGRGEGPTVLVRADMDALPVEEPRAGLRQHSPGHRSGRQGRARHARVRTRHARDLPARRRSGIGPRRHLEWKADGGRAAC